MPTMAMALSYGALALLVECYSTHTTKAPTPLLPLLFLPPSSSFLLLFYLFFHLHFHCLCAFTIPSIHSSSQFSKQPNHKPNHPKETQEAEQAERKQDRARAMAAADLGFEATELRLGLPGGEGGEQARKRGFAETIDLKLKLEPAGKEAAANAAEEVEVKAEVPELEEKAADGGKMKRSPSQSSVVTAAAAMADPAEKPRAPKAQVVGWPPVRSFRKNILQAEKSSSSSPAAFVKVSMDGAPYLRKVDLNMYKTYHDLSMALHKMFSSFTIGNCGSQGMNGMNESKLMDLLNGSEYVPTYEDKDGDWMLVGDVPWEMFVESCKRLRIMKVSEAIGLAPRAMEKCKNRS